MRPFISVVVKPTLECNIGCRHCYHTPEERSPARMSIDVLDDLFKKLSEEYESVWFVWHGGEPLLMPLGFYKDAVALQERHFGKNSHRVGNTIQTNGTLLDRRLVGFCKEKMINIGVSFEGPYNDALRERTEEVRGNLERLGRKEGAFSVSSTISAGTASRQREIYDYFRDNKAAVSFSPVIPAGCAACGGMTPDAEEYIRSSIECFDAWLLDRDAQAPLVPHYLYVLSALGEPAESDCAHASCLTKWICVYPNGDMYPCGKGCPPEFRLGNLSEFGRVSDAFLTEGFGRILEGSVKRREACMAGCGLYGYCNGGCAVDAHYETGIDRNGGDSCRIFKAVFGHVLSTVQGITEARPDLSRYNRFVRDAVMGRLVNPRIGAP
ncbi:MAG: radical SAM protein [Methanomassiliicoccaceae archaeon]|nr:radical SAM protein [Methanomassiliicoccaceae archaeon]